MSKWVRITLMFICGIALFGSGIAVGISKAGYVHGTFVTQDFMKMRLAQCKATMTLYNLATHEKPESREQKHLAFALAGELGSCTALIVNWEAKVQPEDKEIAAKIVATFNESQVDRLHH